LGRNIEMSMFAARVRMIGSAWVVFALFVALTPPTEVRAETAQIEPAAVELLRKMTDYVGGLGRFGLETENMLEEVLVSGQKIQYDFTAKVLIERPNKLRVERTGDLIDQLSIYDGKTLAIHERTRGYYAVTDAPSDLDGLLHFARDTLDLVPPTGDFVYTNAFELLTGSLTSGFVVGKSVVDGVRCDHLAFRNPVVDWQVWIAEGDEPLPRKYVMTTRDDPAQPQYLVLMRNWNLAPKPGKASFAFSAPKGAEKIEFIRVDSGHTAGP
jgi:hypothetical protein